jgi:hypothetical protein
MQLQLVLVEQVDFTYLQQVEMELTLLFLAVELQQLLQLVVVELLQALDKMVAQAAVATTLLRVMLLDLALLVKDTLVALVEVAMVEPVEVALEHEVEL